MIIFDYENKKEKQMDISGVDVDNLSDEEILELCSDIVDCSNEEIAVLKGVDIDNLPDDKVQEIYDNIIYNENEPAEKFIYLTDKQTPDNNFSIVDMKEDEIALISGFNINIDNLSDDEILALYNDITDTEDTFLLASATKSKLCYDIAGLENDDTYIKIVYMMCYSSRQGRDVKIPVMCSKSDEGTRDAYFCGTKGKWAARDAMNGKGQCYFYCTGYATAARSCTSYVYGVTYSTSSSYRPYSCK